jgi:hypothetical protein
MMDPNSSYLLRIKLVGNKRKVRQDLSCYSFTKVVDDDTTNLKDFVESIVNEFPPRYMESAIVQYYDVHQKHFQRLNLIKICCRCLRNMLRPKLCA